MGELRTVCVKLLIVLSILQVHGADEYTDESRPYEFGFTIDGEQHRHEKKDKNGIIMGEFGFITADGVYHVTVYATDENGHFKILSMKNIRVKPYPTVSAHEERMGHSLALTPTKQLSPPRVSTQTQQVPKQETSSIPRSCSNCKVPTTTTPAPKQLAIITTNSNYNTQSQISGNSQRSSQTYHNEQVYSQYENSKTIQLPSQQRSESQNQYNARVTQNYPTQADSVNQKEQLSNKVSNDQYSLQSNTQEDFNVGRKYLQKSKGTQSNGEPNSLKQFSGEQNYNQGLNAAQPQQQEVIANQYNLQVPNVKQYNQQISNSAQSYSHQSGAQVQNVGSRVGQNYNQGSNVAQYQQQEISANQYNLQVPHPNRSVQQSSNYPQSYSQQSGAQVLDYGGPKKEQSYLQANAERNNVKKTNNFVQQENYQSHIKNPNEIASSSAQETSIGDRTPKTFKDIIQTLSPGQQHKLTDGTTNVHSSQQNIGKPVLVAAQMQLVDKNTNIYHKNPGESEGLPKGITEGDMTQLLYTFNYTVGFHGHHEEGYTNGAKIGYYYVTGRNGIRTRVDYVADDKGFHPRISQEVLDIQSDEVPKPETEKDAKYGLKGYEFKWLYFPVSSK